MTGALFLEAAAKFFLGVFLPALLIFVPAGTVCYPGGWIFMAVLFLPMFVLGVVLIVKDPQLLRKRLKDKEQAKEQSMVVKLSALMFLAGFIAAGLSFRFGWFILPVEGSVAAALAFIAGYLLYARVLKENAFLSRVIEIQENQRVVDTGLYGIVRHPMYAATLLLFLSMPLILGSLISFVIFLAYPVLIAKRILHEEAFLEENLEGYRAYKQKVRYRLIPYIW